MYHAGTEDLWLFSYGFNRVIDFCIWVLESDGLLVPPFDHHTGGDGSLQAAGLDPEGWRSWLVKVVDMQYHQAQALRQRGQAQPRSWSDALFTLIPIAHHPPSAWTGNAAIGNRLAELWKSYRPIAHTRGGESERTWAKRRREAKRNGALTRLSNDLQPYQTGLESLIIHFVEYPQVVDYLVPPVSVIMTIVNGQFDDEAFHTRVLHAADALATSTPS